MKWFDKEDDIFFKIAKLVLEVAKILLAVAAWFA